MNTNEPIFKLPPTEIKFVTATLSETIDWGIKQLGIPDTWSITKGKNITVLIIDTGTPDHVDLNDAINISQCRSFIDNEDVYDTQGHSTHCGGIVGARANGIGVIGVAPECNLVFYKALNKDGYGTPQSVTNALKEAILSKPDIVSMSLGSPYPDTEQQKLIKELYNLNIPVIVAAGNEGKGGTGYPAGYEEAISIGAYDKSNNIAYFSSIGKVDFAFPGCDIYSTFLKNKYCLMSGTSMATPMAAGVVALLLAKHRIQEKETGKNDCKTVAQVIEHLKKYSIDAGVTGKDDWYGYGIVDVDKMITTENVNKPIEADPLFGYQEPTKWQKIKDWFWKNFMSPV